MRVPHSAAAASATQPAAKPRLKRAMKAHLVLLWNLVGEAGPEGTTVAALVQRLPAGDATQISNALSYLRSVGYVSVDGRGPGSRWRVTGVPVGQQAPEWMRAAEMPRRPSSVFALAAAPVPADWTLKGRRTPPPAGAKLVDEDDDDDDQAEGVDIDAAHSRPKPGSTASELGWVAPTVVTTATEPPPYLPERASTPHQPHFTLHSDGTFEIHVDNDRDYVCLQPDTTRALFRWLARLGGTHLSRTVEAA